MPSVRDIRAAQRRGTLADIETAFRALLAGEDRISGAGDRGELMDLLQDVCAALYNDDRIMPDDVADLIQAEAGDALTDRTYAAGSRAVRMHSMRWRSFLKQRYPELPDVRPEPMTAGSVEDAIARGDRLLLGRAFHALADWPRVEMVSGLGSVSAALDLLRSVAAALVNRNDHRPMPERLIGLLNGMCEGPEMVVGDTYAAGALFVRDHIERWRPFFRNSFPEDR